MQMVAARSISLIEFKRGDCRYPQWRDKDGEPIVF
jgi:hypothetical protein